jgi:multidrug efflux system membrane fusion protein
MTLSVTAYEADRHYRAGKGRLATVDNQIDTTTGTVKLRAIFDNEQEILFPNQFVNIQLLVRRCDTDIVPERRLSRCPGALSTWSNPTRPLCRKSKVGPADAKTSLFLMGSAGGSSSMVPTGCAKELK